MKRRTFALVGVMTLFTMPGLKAQTSTQSTQQGRASPTDLKAQAKILDQYGKLPLSFEANQGQTDARVKFLSRGHGYSLFLTDREAVIALTQAAPQSAEIKGVSGRDLVEMQQAGAAGGTVVWMELAGANAAPRVSGAEELPGKANYFIGDEPGKWRTNVPTYAKVKYEGVYPGVDLVYYGNQGHLEYDFVVASGVDPNKIRMKFRGAEKLRVDKKGDLLLGSAGEELRFERPVVYQEIGGEKKPVESSYVLASANQIGFQLGEYDHSKQLVIDPVLVYSTYLGGNGLDESFSIAVDASGNAYVTGDASSTNFPMANAPQAIYGGGAYDAFVTKINASGSALVYSTYLGGSSTDYGFGIAVDTSGNAYVMGSTSSTNFPTVNALQSTYGGGLFDAFVTKINASGSALVYSTYLGGSQEDFGGEIALDASANAYVTGTTKSTDFPTTANALQATLGAPANSFITKISPSGSALVYSSYFGGSGEDTTNGIAVDGSGNAYLTGYAPSANFPTTTGAFQTTCCGAFVTKINASGSALVYSTYLGGADDVGYGIAVDTSGNAYVTGATQNTDFPTTSGAFQTTCCGAFITKINASGSALVYSTYLHDATDMGIAVDSSGNAYVTGITGSPNFPTANALQSTLGGSENAFVTKINPSGSALVYSTYLGGSGDDFGNGIAVDSSGNAYVTGYASSTNFPTANALQPTLGGSANAFVAKIASENTLPTTIAIPSPGTNSKGWNDTSVTVALNATDTTSGSGVERIQFSLSGAENIGLQTVAGSAASVTISAQGITILTYFATDNAGNQETAKMLTVQIDLTPPVVTVTGASNGAIYYYEQPPVAGCNTTDALSGVATLASLAVTGGNKFSYGKYTATCSGAMDEAGMAAAPTSVSYRVNGPTAVAGHVERKTGSLNARVWQIIIRNSGPGTAYNAEITNLSLRQASGAVCTPFLESTLPVTAGNIIPSSAATVSVTIDFAGCASNARFILNGQVSANEGTDVGTIVMSTELP